MSPCRRRAGNGRKLARRQNARDPDGASRAARSETPGLLTEISDTDVSGWARASGEDRARRSALLTGVGTRSRARPRSCGRGVATASESPRSDSVWRSTPRRWSGTSGGTACRHWIVGLLRERDRDAADERGVVADEREDHARRGVPRNPDVLGFPFRARLGPVLEDDLIVPLTASADLEGDEVVGARRRGDEAAGIESVSLGEAAGDGGGRPRAEACGASGRIRTARRKYPATFGAPAARRASGGRGRRAAGRVLRAGAAGGSAGAGRPRRCRRAVASPALTRPAASGGSGLRAAAARRDEHTTSRRQAEHEAEGVPFGSRPQCCRSRSSCGRAGPRGGQRVTCRRAAGTGGAAVQCSIRSHERQHTRR